MREYLVAVSHVHRFAMSFVVVSIAAVVFMIICVSYRVDGWPLPNDGLGSVPSNRSTALFRFLSPLPFHSFCRLHTADDVGPGKLGPQ